MLWIGWGLLLVLVKCTWYEPRDIRVKCSFFVVSSELDSDKELAFLVHRDIIIFLEHAD